MLVKINLKIICLYISFTFLIAMASNVAVVGAFEDGKLTKVASNVGINSYPVWSPSGNEILFTRDAGNYESNLYKVMSDGSSEKKLSDGAFYYSWSPDGNKISYCQDTKDENGISGYALWTMNKDGTNKNQLLDPAIGDWHYYYAWFPSGLKILYELGQFPNDHGWLWEINTDGSNNYEIGGDTWVNGQFAVSPDNSKIAYVTYDPDPINYPPEIRIHNLNLNNYYTLTDGIIVQQTQSWQSETWSPDGKKIVYYFGENGHSDLYTINVDGTGKTQLTSDSSNNTNPIFSPDGAKILYLSDKTGSSGIWVMDADGKNKVQLTTYTTDSSPAWSPDGKKIAFYSARGGDHAIYVLSLVDNSVTAPVASFYCNVTNGLAPLSVKFTDTSTGTPTSWLWDFGDGYTSNEKSPVHTYFSVGNYTVNLTVSNANGTASKSTSINVSKPVIPIFPGCTKPPADPNNEGLYEDINGNGRLDFADVVTYYNNMAWVTQNGLVAYFDYNRNGRIDFSDVVKLYNMH